MIRFAGPGEEAVAAANGCWAAEKALGPDIVRPWWSMGCGSSESGTDSGYAEWSFPVAGVDGNGSLSYMAEKSGGVWRIQHEVLETRGLYISVVPCSGEISKADARGKMTGGVERTGKVAEVSGSAPVATGDRCTVKVLKDPDYPNGVPFNCQVRVDCGHGVIYGDKASNGYNFCAVRDGRPVTAFDGAGSADSSDPMLDMNLPKNGVTISDDRPTPYSFTIALE
jgi:hypothetical protein